MDPRGEALTGAIQVIAGAVLAFVVAAANSQLFEDFARFTAGLMLGYLAVLVYVRLRQRRRTGSR